MWPDLCEISTLWQELKCLWQLYEGLFSIWQIMLPTSANFGQYFMVLNGQIMKTVKVIWSHCNCRDIIHFCWIITSVLITNVVAPLQILPPNERYFRKGTAIAQWIRLLLLSCGPGFEFHAHHLCFSRILCFVWENSKKARREGPVKIVRCCRRKSVVTWWLWPVWPVKNPQMSLKVAQKWFH